MVSIPHFENIFEQFLPVHQYNDSPKEAAKKAGLTRKLRFRYDYAQDSAPTITFEPINERICNAWARNWDVFILS